MFLDGIKESVFWLLSSQRIEISSQKRPILISRWPFALCEEALNLRWSPHAASLANPHSGPLLQMPQMLKLLLKSNRNFQLLQPARFGNALQWRRHCWLQDNKGDVLLLSYL